MAPCNQRTVLRDTEGRDQTVECVYAVNHEGQCAGWWLHIGNPEGYQWWGANNESYDD